MNRNQLKFLAVILILALLQVSLVKFDLVLVGVLLLAFLGLGRQALIQAFLAGILLDLLGGYPLGVHAVLFIIFSLVILTIKAKLLAAKSRPFESTFWLVIPFLLLPALPMIVAYDFLVHLSYQLGISFRLDLGKLLADLVLIILLYPFFSYLSLRWRQPEGIQLDFRRQL